MLATHKMMDEIKIILIPHRPNFAQVGTFICTAKMSTEMTFWHLWVPNKSKHHVHILQACVSFSLAVACDLLCNYCACHSEQFLAGQ